MDRDTQARGSTKRGDPRYVLALFLALAAVGTAIQVANGEATFRQALLPALAIAVPFSAYAWYEGWGR